MFSRKELDADKITLCASNWTSSSVIRVTFKKSLSSLILLNVCNIFDWKSFHWSLNFSDILKNQIILKNDWMNLALHLNLTFHKLYQNGILIETSFTSNKVKLRLRFYIHLTFTWCSPDHLTIIWPSPDPCLMSNPLLTLIKRFWTSPAIYLKLHLTFT